MEKNEYLGAELEAMGLEAANAVLRGKTVRISVEGVGHTATYTNVGEVLLSTCEERRTAVLLKPINANFWVPVNSQTRVTILNQEGG